MSALRGGGGGIRGDRAKPMVMATGMVMGMGMAIMVSGVSEVSVASVVGAGDAAAVAVVIANRSLNARSRFSFVARMSIPRLLRF